MIAKKTILYPQESLRFILGFPAPAVIHLCIGRTTILPSRLKASPNVEKAKNIIQSMILIIDDVRALISSFVSFTIRTVLLLHREVIVNACYTDNHNINVLSRYRSNIHRCCQKGHTFPPLMTYTETRT